MKSRHPASWIALFVAVLCLMAALVVAFLYRFFPAESSAMVAALQHNRGQAALAAVLLLALIIVGINLCYRLIVLPLHKMVEETALIGSVNSAHRLKSTGGPLFGPLAQAINTLAGRFEAVQQYGQEKVESIRAAAEKERNMLAAIMAGLPEGVLVCNTLGSIVLYNQQAKQLLNGGANRGGRPGHASEVLIGLWRPIRDVIDGNQLQHALNEIQAKFRESDKNAVARFVTSGADGKLLRVEVFPVLDHSSAYAGFILIIRDITQRLQAAGQVEGTLTTVERGIRNTSATIRAAIESIMAYPDLDRSQLDRLREVIHKESITLGALIGKIDASFRSERTEWPLTPVETSVLIGNIRKRAMEKLGVDLQVELDLPKCFIKADAYALTLSVLFVLDRLQTGRGPVPFTCRLERKENILHLDFSWPGEPVKMEALRSWENSLLQVHDEHLPFPLATILRHHHIQLGAYPSPEAENRGCLRFFIPPIDSVPLEPARRVTILSQSRPEFFDFDLFGRREPAPELAHRFLSELTYSVFDTETTGLNPGEDEIIAIGAVRIVNGRILLEESFDQLIDPLRNIPMSSTRIHGIYTEMVKDKPPIVQVLPRFQRFVADTILVGHNVAFDMRLLQVKEEATRIRLANPVLDTLLLSAVLHPAQSDHRLEAIAERLGVTIEGRHTAMGDAIATAKIFLKMLPLMAENGILTLDDVMRASQKTIYARIKY